MDAKKIIIVGGGFAGINLAKQLAGDMRFEVALVDKNNYHFFPPLLYQVAVKDYTDGGVVLSNGECYHSSPKKQ